jgi:chromosome segregation ATPase
MRIRRFAADKHMDDRSELWDQIDRLSKDIEEASAECHRLYDPWYEACERLRKLERERAKAHDALFKSALTHPK